MFPYLLMLQVLRRISFSPGPSVFVLALVLTSLVKTRLYKELTNDKFILIKAGDILD